MLPRIIQRLGIITNSSEAFQYPQLYSHQYIQNDAGYTTTELENKIKLKQTSKNIERTWYRSKVMLWVGLRLAHTSLKTKGNPSTFHETYFIYSWDQFLLLLFLLWNYSSSEGTAWSNEWISFKMVSFSWNLIHAQLLKKPESPCAANSTTGKYCSAGCCHLISSSAV